MAVFPNSIALPKTRAEIENLIEAALMALDEMDSDPDLEPSLGWTATESSFDSYSFSTDDLEATCDEDEAILPNNRWSTADPEFSPLNVS